MQFHGRSVAVASIGLCAVLVATSACGSDTGSAPPAASAAESTTSALPVTTAAPTTAPLVPPEHLTSCIENAKFQAFIGNEFWSEMWAEAGKTDAGMRSVCEFLGNDDPGALAIIHLNWVALQQATGSTDDTITDDTITDETATEPTLADQALDTADTVSPDLGAPDPGLVAACVNWVRYRRLAGDARAVAMWTNAEGSVTAIRDACTGIVRADPAQAEMMRVEVEELESGP